MTMARRLPRRDPLRLFHIQSDFAAGLAPTDIAKKHELPVPAVLQIVRGRKRDDGLLDPFQLAHDGSRGRSATQMYWMGYIAACGRLYHQGPSSTLVLDVDRRDVEHVRQLIEDLVPGRTSCEFCESNQNGLQAYIRDRDLGTLLSQWGIPSADPTEGSVPISLIPGSLLPHFVRGYLEGSRNQPPFGRTLVPATMASIRTVTLVGPQDFVTALAAALRKHVGIGPGTITGRRDGLKTLTFKGTKAKKIVQYAYRDPTRSIPRAAKFVQSIRPR
jgi:hypothetical protein